MLNTRPNTRLETKEGRPKPELWGGVECTLNRVENQYFDQLERNGHIRRLTDLDQFASLGLCALRCPVLWERTAPHGLDTADWEWPDACLSRLHGLGITPIIGLVHHGSGPPGTSLEDPEFPQKLARYARAVAERYPWVTHYTPINEPLTTARFSGLYGHWYPHRKDDRACLTMLLNQCRAVTLAMEAIREVNPAARLVQTEDLGQAHSTPALSYQANFENERRWLSFDLLCGRVDRGHPLWGYLRWLGVSEAALLPFWNRPCPPDVLGINYYVTSERFLDDRVDCYPERCIGGNGRHRYADVEAVRVCAEGIAGPEALLREAWQRYGRPIAVTEVHLGDTPDEQIRWFGEVWDAACRLCREGADIQAVAAWSLLGAYDWDSLVTRAAGHYEPGVFALAGSGPQATPLAALLRDLAALGRSDHPALQTPGWWHRPERLLYPARSRFSEICEEVPAGSAERSAPRVLSGSAA